MTNQNSPVQGGPTEEQIEAAALVSAASRYEYINFGRKWADLRSSEQDEWVRSERLLVPKVIEAALSVSPSADPAGEHHDAETMQKVNAALSKFLGTEREVILAIGEMQSAGILFRERQAESEDHAATATGESLPTYFSPKPILGFLTLKGEPSSDREKLIERKLRDLGVEDGIDMREAVAFVITQAEECDALAAPVEVDEDKLAEVIDAAERSTRTGSKPHRHRVVAHAVAEWLLRGAR